MLPDMGLFESPLRLFLCPAPLTLPSPLPPEVDDDDDEEEEEEEEDVGFLLCEWCEPLDAMGAAAPADGWYSYFHSAEEEKAAAKVEEGPLHLCIPPPSPAPPPPAAAPICLASPTSCPCRAWSL